MLGEAEGTKEDPIADDYWSYETRDGTRRTSRVTIGRPAPLADKRDWYCPILFEHVTEGIYYSYGVGPVDALMNAMYFVGGELASSGFGSRLRAKEHVGVPHAVEPRGFLLAAGCQPDKRHHYRIERSYT